MFITFGSVLYEFKIINLFRRGPTNDRPLLHRFKLRERRPECLEGERKEGAEEGRRVSRSALEETVDAGPLYL